MDEAPAAIEAGLAAMVTAGVTTGSVGGVPDFAVPQPASVSKSGNSNIAARDERLQNGQYGRVFIAVRLLTWEVGINAIGAQSRKIGQKAPLSIGEVGNVRAFCAGT